MGRPRQTNRHLPRRMQVKHGAYWHVCRVSGKQRWTRLADDSDYGAALRAWADIEGQQSRAGQTIAEAVTTYLAHCEQRVAAGELSAKTASGYRGSSLCLLAVLGRVYLRDLTDQDVRRYRSTRKREDGRPAPTAANRELALLSASYSHAAELGWIPALCNPCRGVKRNRERPRRRYVTDDEMKQALAHAPPLLSAAIRIAYCTGMRQTDLLKLRLSDDTPDGLVVRASKTGKPLVYRWVPELRAAVDDARGLRRKVGSLWLFPSPRDAGKHWTVDGLETMWDRCREAAGLHDVQWRDWRRKAGSDTSEAHATELLDHSNPATTKRHYRAAPKVVTPLDRADER